MKLFLDDLILKASHKAHHETIDKGHGRIEVRRSWISHDIDWLLREHKWPGLKMIGVVESERHVGEKIGTERVITLVALNSKQRISWMLCALTGKWKACTGSSTWPSEKMSVASERISAQRIWLYSDKSPPTL